MNNVITEPLLETINYAIEKKISHPNCDFTLICRVVKIHPDSFRSYQIQHKDALYNITTKNISLKLQDTVHLVIPEGNFADKYILEDAALEYIQRR